MYKLRGYRVHPVVGKIPILQDWTNAATTDPPDEWTEVGIATGRGLVVIDLDVKHGVDGVAVWSAWAEDHGVEWEPTVTTPSGGQHIYFRSDKPLRNRTGMLPGVDVRAEGGFVVAYGDVPPLDDLPELPDVVAELIGERRSGSGSQRHVGPVGIQNAVEREVFELEITPEGRRNDRLNLAAFNLGQLVGDQLSEEYVIERLSAAADECGLPADEAMGTIQSALQAGMENPRDTTPRSRPKLDDTHFSEYLANEYMQDWIIAGGDWYRWDGRRWEPRTNDDLVEAVRQAVRDHLVREASEGAEDLRIRALTGLLSKARIVALATLLRGILARDARDLDAHSDLLNVGNGVVNLRTGELKPHDRSYMFTKITETEYVKGAVHPDWFIALTALGQEQQYLQVFLGQAITGEMNPDDRLLIMKGGGANGKSTVLDAVSAALGGFAVHVPEKLIIANPNDHSTDLTTLQGARLAILEELPEGRQLSVKRLKDTVGSPTITARKLFHDNVTWRATHTLVISTNHTPGVAETDHGTWRRLALLPFTKTYGEDGQPKDKGLRARLGKGNGGRAEAVLAWLVAGARSYYAYGMPALHPVMEKATQAWREESDPVLKFINDELEFDPGSVIPVTALTSAFNDSRPNQLAWSDRTVAERFGDHLEFTRHGVVKKLVKTKGKHVSTRLGERVPDAKKAWVGVRFKNENGWSD